jgi:hypothetical protein
MVEQHLSVVDKLVILILAFHDAHPEVSIESIKHLVREVGDITTDFAMEVTKEQINKTLKSYEDN